MSYVAYRDDDNNKTYRHLFHVLFLLNKIQEYTNEVMFNNNHVIQTMTLLKQLEGVTRYVQLQNKTPACRQSNVIYSLRNMNNHHAIIELYACHVISTQLFIYIIRLRVRTTAVATKASSVARPLWLSNVDPG